MAHGNRQQINIYNPVRNRFSRDFLNGVCFLLFFYLICFGFTGCVYRSWSVLDEVEYEDVIWSQSTPSSTKINAKKKPLTTPRVLSLSIRSDRLPTPTPKRDVQVQKQIEIFQRHGFHFIRQSLARKSKYGKQLEAVLESEGVPSELIALAIVESGMREKIRSPSGAVGLWQFMRPTAKKYGLRINLFRDDRKDPLKSTRAAAKYLRDLYQAYEDWSLALAAYNAGETKVSSIIRETGLSDFWELAKIGRFPKQTRVHVYKFHAVLSLLQEGEVLDGDVEEIS